MNYFIYSSLFNAITSALCCLFVSLSKNKTKTSKTFFFFSLSVFLWSSTYFIWITSTSEQNALFSSRLLNMIALFIPLTFFHFCCHLLNKYRKFKKTICFLYIFNLILSPMTLTSIYISHVEHISIFNYWPKPGPLYILFPFEYITIISLALFELFKKLRNTKEIREKRMLQFVFYGLVVGFIGGSTNLPLFYNIPILPFGNILVSFYTFGILYAIFKYQFMDISIVLKRSLIYTILIFLLTLFSFLSIFLIENIFKELVGYKSFLFSTGSATVIAIFFIPLKNLIQEFVEKTFFRGSYAQISEENKLLRKEILQTERLKSVATLASGMAHEIKNPLTVLKTFSEYLPQKLNDKEFLTKFAPIVSEEVDRIDHLVHELLEFAKPANPILKPTNLPNLIDSTVELLSNEHIKHHINIHKDYRLDANIVLLLDSNQMKQALLNILLNAIDAMPNGGQLYVSTILLVDSKIIQIKIQDTGIGIDPQDLSHIFDPFFSKKDGGTGLGLAITFEIIKKHGGKIFVESTAGKGSTFILELPLNPTTTHPS